MPFASVDIGFDAKRRYRDGAADCGRQLRIWFRPDRNGRTQPGGRCERGLAFFARLPLVVSVLS